MKRYKFLLGQRVAISGWEDIRTGKSSKLEGIIGEYNDIRGSYGILITPKKGDPYREYWFHDCSLKLIDSKFQHNLELIAKWWADDDDENEEEYDD